MKVSYISYVGMSDLSQHQINEMCNGDRLLNYLLKKNKLTIQDLKGKSRKKEVVLVRYIYWYLFKKLYFKTKKYTSSARLGCVFEKDHATVLHAYKTIQGRVETEPKFRKYINELYEKFERIKNQKLYEL